jgi:3-hydroxybutyryl-CoA dehydratase
MTEPITRDEFRAGERASFAKTVSDDDVRTLAEVTGDFNPLHMDEEYARKTRFGQRIVHGVFSAGLISAVLGNQLPGPGSIYLSQQVEFLAPVFIGDTVTATVEVVSWRADKKIITLKTDCHNQHNKQVVAGQAVLMVPGTARKNEGR